jgi:endonuclease YncB( thermonuclease family)
MSTPLLAFRSSSVPYLTPAVFRAAVNRVVDGDTIWVEADTSFRTSHLIELRVTGNQWKGFNAPERFTDNGRVATALVQRLCPVGSIIRIETAPDIEKYGRWLTPVFIPVVPNGYAPDVVVVKDGITYLDLAAHMVATVPGSIWQVY